MKEQQKQVVLWVNLRKKTVEDLIRNISMSEKGGETVGVKEEEAEWEIENESKRIKMQARIWIINQKNNRNHSFNVGRSAVGEEGLDIEIVLDI